MTQVTCKSPISAPTSILSHKACNLSSIWHLFFECFVYFGPCKCNEYFKINIHSKSRDQKQETNVHKFLFSINLGIREVISFVS